jgi:hypothetical protein
MLCPRRIRPGGADPGRRERGSLETMRRRLGVGKVVVDRQFIERRRTLGVFAQQGYRRAWHLRAGAAIINAIHMRRARPSATP